MTVVLSHFGDPSSFSNGSPNIHPGAAEDCPDPACQAGEDE